MSRHLTEGEPAARPAPGPTAPDERLVAIDVLRGLAIFGILLVNMGSFSTPLYALYMDAPYWTAPADRAAEGLIRVLAENKFYTLFSFLFGLGFALQMQRVAARGGRFVRLFVRRLLVLLVIGVCHALLFWHGDVLTIYAVLGFALLLVPRWPNRVILAGALVVYGLPLLRFGYVAAGVERERLDPQYEASIEPWLAERDAELLEQVDETTAVFREGSFGRMLTQRLRDHLYILDDTVYYFLPGVFSMFLLGLYVGRRRIMHDPAAHRPLLRWLTWIGLPLGLLCSTASVVIDEQARWIASWATLGAYALQLMGTPLLSFGYAAAIVLLVMKAEWRTRLAPLAVVGRVALTNYLLQTLICTTLFYSYGLALFGKIGPALGLLLSVVIYAVQIPLSGWWLRRFRFGPMEWLWRSLTYLKWQPMRVPRRRGLPPPTQGLIE